MRNNVIVKTLYFVALIIFLLLALHSIIGYRLIPYNILTGVLFLCGSAAFGIQSYNNDNPSSGKIGKINNRLTILMPGSNFFWLWEAWFREFRQSGMFSTQEYLQLDELPYQTFGFYFEGNLNQLAGFLAKQGIADYSAWYKNLFQELLPSQESSELPLLTIPDLQEMNKALADKGFSDFGFCLLHYDTDKLIKLACNMETDRQSDDEAWIFLDAGNRYVSKVNFASYMRIHHALKNQPYIKTLWEAFSDLVVDKVQFKRWQQGQIPAIKALHIDHVDPEQVGPNEDHKYSRLTDIVTF